MLYYVVNIQHGFTAHEFKNREDCNTWIAASRSYGIPRWHFVITHGAKERDAALKNAKRTYLDRAALNGLVR